MTFQIEAAVTEHVDAPFTYRQLFVDEAAPGEILVRIVD